MNDSSLVLSKIIENNSLVRADAIQRIIILYDAKIFAIGDTCVSIARLRKSAAFYKNASIDLNTLNTKHYQLICNITKNNPYINNYYNLSWDEIDFSKYDLIICGCVPESPFFDFICLKYGEKLIAGLMRTAIFSAMGNVGFDEQRNGKPMFPINLTFNEFRLSAEESGLMGANELFINESETNWSLEWLSNNGLGIRDNLVIFLDSSSARDKLLSINHYFDILTYVLKLKNIKVLIFDEGGIGKKEFYTQWLGPELSANLIFAENMSIRDAICLIASEQTKLMFGPSTGLLHCASGIFNVLIQKKRPLDLVPILIGYVGKCEGSYEEDQWWGQSLVDTIVPIRNGTSNELHYLKNINFREISLTNKLLNSQEITSESLINFIKSNYSDRLRMLGIDMESLVV